MVFGQSSDTTDLASLSSYCKTKELHVFNKFVFDSSAHDYLHDWVNKNDATSSYRRKRYFYWKWNYAWEVITVLRKMPQVHECNECDITK